jgi:hypothetical protein
MISWSPSSLPSGVSGELPIGTELLRSLFDVSAFDDSAAILEDVGFDAVASVYVTPSFEVATSPVPVHASNAFNGQCKSLPDAYAHREQRTLRPRLVQSPNGRHRKPRS